MTDDEMIAAVTLFVDELRALVDEARRSGLSPAERERFVELRARLAGMRAELAFLVADDDGAAVRAILAPPAGIA